MRATREGHDVLENKFGLDSVKKLLSEIEPEIQHVDLGWAEQFCQALFPSSMEEMKRVLERSRTELPAPLDHALTFNMALDLNGGGRHLKVYMFPMAKNLATGRERDARDAGLDAVRGLKPYGDRLTPAVDFLDHYWDRCPDKLTLDMIGLDCIDPSNARIKIYAHLSERNSWQVVRDIVTFGGKVSWRIHSLSVERTTELRVKTDGERNKKKRQAIPNGCKAWIYCILYGTSSGTSTTAAEMISTSPCAIHPLFWEASCSALR